MVKKYLISAIILIFGVFILIRYSFYVKPILYAGIKYIMPAKQFKSQDDLILKLAFTDPMICESIFPEIKTLVDFNNQYKKLLCSDIALDSMYDAIKINSTKKHNNNILSINYNIGNDQFDAYVFDHSSSAHKDVATIIIPGSGQDMSWKIENNVPVEGYRLDDLLEENTSMYIFIKPNESVCSMFSNGKKLNYNAVYAKLINEGKSYSKLYIQHAIAVVKYLKSKHLKVITFGLSQGGLANLIVSNFTKPDYAWICAGYSQLYDDYYFAGPNQIISNDIKKFISSEYVKKKVTNIPTKFYFAYGKNDGDFYNYEYNTHYTEKSFKGIGNTSFVYFDGDHDYPYDNIKMFIENKFNH